MGDWAKVIETATKCIVQVRSVGVRTFECQQKGPGVGTAFVVDKQLGICLTNRHVVSSAPTISEVVFVNDEEVKCEPLYVDPCHDFGFFKFDPAQVKFMKFGQLSLKPSAVKKGLEICVVGSDSGEKIMLLHGTISTLDRNPPEYMPGTGFTDHNTFYITASCDTSGGSSGSPVLDRKAQVVALNAGASYEATSSFFLPIDKAVHALEMIQKRIRSPKPQVPMKELIPRGTILTVFAYMPMPSARRLGVSETEEEVLREHLKPNANDLLVVAQAIPESRAHEQGLENGDVVLKVNGMYCNRFFQLEQEFDSHVGSTITLEVKRGSKVLRFSIVVDDAYEAMIPNEFLEFSGAIVSRIGFSLAFDFGIPLHSLLIEETGYAFDRCEMADLCVISSIDGQKMESLCQLQNVLSSKRHNDQVFVRYFHVLDKNIESLTVLHVDRKWSKIKICRRDLSRFGDWEYETSPEPSENVVQVSNNRLGRRASFGHLPREPMNERHLEPLKSLVLVQFSCPVPIDGNVHKYYIGTGFVVDKSLGLIVTDRNTCVSLLGEAEIVVAGSYQIPGKVIYLHPLHNFAVVQCDPCHFEGIDAQSLHLCDNGARTTKKGDMFAFLAFSFQRRVLYMPNQQVASIEQASVTTGGPPRFGAKNFEVIKFEREIPEETLGGVFINQETNQATMMWSSFSVREQEQVYRATFMDSIRASLEDIRSELRKGSHNFHPIFTIGCEYRCVTLNYARTGLRLPPDWYKTMATTCDETIGYRFVLTVVTVFNRNDSQLLVGDVLLACEGVATVSLQDYEEKANELGRKGKTHISITVLRNGTVMDLHVQLDSLSCLGTRRIVNFMGIQCQDTHDAAWMHFSAPPFMKQDKKSGVFVTRVEHGSPGERGGMHPVRWITEMNDVQVQDLDQLLEQVCELKDGQSVRIRSVGIHEDQDMCTPVVNFTHFKTKVLSCDIEGDWRLEEI